MGRHHRDEHRRPRTSNFSHRRYRSISNDRTDVRNRYDENRESTRSETYHELMRRLDRMERTFNTRVSRSPIRRNRTSHKNTRNLRHESKSSDHVTDSDSDHSRHRLRSISKSKVRKTAERDMDSDCASINEDNLQKTTGVDNEHANQKTADKSCSVLDCSDKKEEGAEDLLDICAPLDPDLQELLGESPIPNDLPGKPIHKEIASRWEHWIKKGISKEEISTIRDNYSIPKNVLFVKSPKLNPELEGLAEPTLKKDLVFSQLQSQVAIAMSIVASCSQKLIISDEPNVGKKEIFSSLTDAGKILADLQHKISYNRRASLKPTLQTHVKKAVETTEVGDFLFGNDLSTKIKSSKELEKMTNEIKTPNKSVQKTAAKTVKTKPLTGSLNYQGPPRQKYNYRRSGRQVYKRTARK